MTLEGGNQHNFAQGCQKRWGRSGLSLSAARQAALAAVSQAGRVPAHELRKPRNESWGVCPRMRIHRAQRARPRMPCPCRRGPQGSSGQGPRSGTLRILRVLRECRGGTEGKAVSPARASRLLCWRKAGHIGLDGASQFGKS